MKYLLELARRLRETDLIFRIQEGEKRKVLVESLKGARGKPLAHGNIGRENEGKREIKG